MHIHPQISYKDRASLVENNDHPKLKNDIKYAKKYKHCFINKKSSSKLTMYMPCPSILNFWKGHEWGSLCKLVFNFDS